MPPASLYPTTLAPVALRETVTRALPGIGAEWQPLSGGRTNHVWRVGDVVVKSYDPAAASALFPNDPLAEVAALRHFAPLGLAPDLLAFGAAWVAYRHVPGQAWGTDVASVATLLARLHQSPLPLPPFRMLATGAQALAEQTRQMMAMAGLHAEIPQTPDLPPVTPRPVHGDAVAGNIIVGPQGLRLIDWQCPALGDPAEDIATFLSPAMQTLYRGHPLSLPQVKAFLAAYPDASVAKRYRSLRPLFRLRMQAHCLLRAARGDAGYAAAALAERDAP